MLVNGEDSSSINGLSNDVESFGLLPRNQSM